MKTKIIFSIVLILIFSTSFIPSINLDEMNKPDSNQIRVMNFNLHFGVEINVGYSLDGFKDQIEESKPAIIGFQEVTFNSFLNGFTNMFGDLKEIMSSMGYKYSYFQEEGRYYLRNAVFSQFEILSAKTIDYTEQNMFHRSILHIEVDVNGKTAHVLVTHLTHLPENESGVTQSGSVRLSQALEFATFASNIQPSQNIIGMGDFNSNPGWEEYLTLTSFFLDSWNETNPGEDGFTFPSDSSLIDIPSKRIDYIFVSSDITPGHCEVKDTKVSDHRPILCDITLS